MHNFGSDPKMGRKAIKNIIGITDKIRNMDYGFENRIILRFLIFTMKENAIILRNFPLEYLEILEA